VGGAHSWRYVEDWYSFEEPAMWTRRVLLATMVAAAALSITRHVPASGNGGSGFAAHAMFANAQR
jgi:hypothetical protein